MKQAQPRVLRVLLLTSLANPAMANAPIWCDPVWVAALMALDGAALGGTCLKGAYGPGRDVWLDLLQSLLPNSTPVRRCPASIDEERLLGGLDLTASLASGTSILQRGLLSETNGGFVVFTMAECLPKGLGAQIVSALDLSHINVARDGVQAQLPARFAFILLDEGQDDDERAPDALLERCAFRLNTEILPVALGKTERPDPAQIAAALAQLRLVEPIPDSILEALCETAVAFGIDSLRPVIAAASACCAVAALHGRKVINLDDAAIAARLILAPIATVLPASPQQEEQAASPPSDTENNQQERQQDWQQEAPSPDQQPDQEPSTQTSSSDAPPADMLIETVKAALPDGVVAALMAARAGPRKARDRDGRGNGDAVQSAKRGRPIGSRRGSLRSGNRLHLIDTLRAAAPWQKVRQTNEETKRVLVRPEDIRIRRFVEKRETTIVFAVDASGSSAWQRLSEAKGAVQMMLSHAYQTRARVALVAFRKDSAEIVLPPTRSLARARRLLGDMVGGGGTPLAHGLETALNLALSERKKGRTPRLLILTDGQANIARDGSPGRPQANLDAHAMARRIAAFDIAAVHIDTAPRPRTGGDELAKAMRAKYAPLPNPRSTDLASLADLAK